MVVCRIDNQTAACPSEDCLWPCRSLHERHGVQEYWLFHPADEMVMAHHLGKDGQYAKARIFDRDDTLQSVLLAELEMELADISEICDDGPQQR